MLKYAIVFTLANIENFMVSGVNQSIYIICEGFFYTLLEFHMF